MAVGRSSRSHNKHRWIEWFIYNCCAAIASGSDKIGWLKLPIWVIDCCAGDGIYTDHVYTSSPRIIVEHGNRCVKANIPFRATFIEKDKNTFLQLQKNLAAMNPLFPYECLNMDVQQYEVKAIKNQAILLLSDPNALDINAMPKDWETTLPDSMLAFITLGCNVGGLKRMEIEKRQLWFDHILTFGSLVKDRHDIVLTELMYDASQWLYMTRIPKVWTKNYIEFVYQTGIQVRVASHKNQEGKFGDILNRCFYTKAEYEKYLNCVECFSEVDIYRSKCIRQCANYKKDDSDFQEQLIAFVGGDW